jgi:hypothetical protein
MKVLAICILAVIMIGCKGETGSTGPTGPQGNANVKTANYIIYPGDYHLTSGIYICQKVCELITTEIVNYGAVLVYRSSVSDNTYMQYPLTLTYDYNKDYKYTFLFSYFKGYINFMVEDSNPNSSTLPNGATGYFKVIVITGNPGLLKYIDKSDYGAVKTALNLMD